MLATFVSLIFLAAFTIYLYFSFFIVNIIKNKKEYFVFLAICICLAIWSFAFSIANSASNLETALFWRRVSSIGWGMIYCFLFHFYLVLSGYNNRIRTKIIYSVIYLPGFLTVFIFGINNNTVKTQYNLIETELGWVNITVGNQLDTFFNLYYATYILMGLAVLWLWQKKSDDHNVKQESTILMLSVIISVVLGTLTEIIINAYSTLKVPQLAPVIILIPIASIYYCVNKYNLMSPPVLDNQSKRGVILSAVSKEKMYYLITLGFLGGSILNIAAVYLIMREGLNETLIFSAELAFVGISIMLIRKLNIPEAKKDFSVIMIASLSIPFITLRFIEYASISVWAFPFCLIILSTIFSNRTLLIPLVVSTFFTQLWVLSKGPYVSVTVDPADHLIRIGLLFIGFYLSTFVNRVYMNRLKEIENQSCIQDLISKISSDFININAYNYEDKINRMLDMCRNYFELDTMKLLLDSKEPCDALILEAWNKSGLIKMNQLQNRLFKEDWIIRHLEHGEICYLPDISEANGEICKVKNLYMNEENRSVLLIPVRNKESLRGTLIISSSKNKSIIKDEDNRVIKILVNILTDALIKVNDEKEIAHLAYHDSLTNLPNRILFRRNLDNAIQYALNNDKLVGVIFIDLDAFKAVNDTVGHYGGDMLLQHISSKICSCLDKDDSMCRFGGDEFLIMVSRSNLQEVIGAVDSIFHALKEPVMIEDIEFYITISAGVSIYPYDGDTSEMLIKNADLSMYQAKGIGRNRYIVCTKAIKQEEEKKMRLASSLTKALENNEMELYYQPQIELKSSKIVGLEALIRWNHKEYGQVMPAEFIPIAEQNGFIHALGEWVIKTACIQRMQWFQKGLKETPVAVNLSLEQLYHDNIVDMIKSIICETQIMPELLEIEITESVAIKKTSSTLNKLKELKELGITISIDDFGTEYSSLNRINQLPIDRLKMAMPFVHGISKNKKDEAIVVSVINLAKNLGIRVIAEGVETEDQLLFLKKHSCDEVQGYYYYKPMSGVLVEKVLIGHY